jgi:hypothetical protein
MHVNNGSAPKGSFFRRNGAYNFSDPMFLTVRKMGSEKWFEIRATFMGLAALPQRPHKLANRNAGLKRLGVFADKDLQ